MAKYSAVTQSSNDCVNNFCQIVLWARQGYTPGSAFPALYFNGMVVVEQWKGLGLLCMGLSSRRPLLGLKTNMQHSPIAMYTKQLRYFRYGL